METITQVRPATDMATKVSIGTSIAGVGIAAAGLALAIRNQPKQKAIDVLTARVNEHDRAIENLNKGLTELKEGNAKILDAVTKPRS